MRGHLRLQLRCKHSNNWRCDQPLQHGPPVRPLGFEHGCEIAVRHRRYQPKMRQTTRRGAVRPADARNDVRSFPGPAAAGLDIDPFRHRSAKPAKPTHRHPAHRIASHQSRHPAWAIQGKPHRAVRAPAMTDQDQRRPVARHEASSSAPLPMPEIVNRKTRRQGCQQLRHPRHLTRPSIAHAADAQHRRPGRDIIRRQRRPRSPATSSWRWPRRRTGRESSSRWRPPRTGCRAGTAWRSRAPGRCAGSRH